MGLLEELDEHLNKLWDEGILNQERLDEINKMDLHQLDSYCRIMTD